MSSLQPLLAHAEQAILARRWSDALSSLRAAWEVARVEPLAHLVERVSAVIEPSLSSLAAGRRDAMQKEWLAVESRREVVDLPRLVRAVSQTHGRSTEARVRARRLRRWSADPRVPALLVAELSAPVFRASSTRPYWEEIFALFIVHADPRALPMLEAYAARVARVLRRPEEQAMRAWLQRRALETARALKAACPRVEASPALAARCAELAARIEEATHRESRLLAAVFAAPDDDEVRAVCSDRLQELDDPRGELIALQLAEARGEGETGPRIAALLAKHAHQWLGALRDVVVPERCTFDRGFLDHAVIRPDAEDAVSRALDAAEWSTVRAIRSPWYACLPALLGGPAGRSLEHLSTDSLRGLR